MHEDIADFALKHALKLGVDYAEVRLQDTDSNSFALKNGIPEGTGFGKILGIGIRYLYNEGLGFVSTNDFDKENVKRLIQESINKTKKAAKIKETVKLSTEEPHKMSYEVEQKIKLRDIAPEEKVKFLKELDKDILASKVNVPGRYISLSDNITAEYLITSEGTQIKAVLPRIGLFYIMTIAEAGKSSQRYTSYGATGGWEQLKNWKLNDVIKEEVIALKNVITKGKKVNGNFDVVCGPEVVGIMVHESVGHPYEADRILGREAAQAGESFVTRDMIGKRIGSDVVNVADDPTLPNGFGFYLYDNEGVKARRKLLMKNGVINGFLHNRATAAEMGIKSNGSSRAVQFDRESIVRMSNTILLPGEHSEEELIKDVKNGIYMKNFMEWNIDDKRYNQKYTGSEAYLIKNGEISQPVINPIIEITTPQIWGAVDAIAKEPKYFAGNCGKGEPMQSIPVWFGGPSMRLRNIRIG